MHSIQQSSFRDPSGFVFIEDGVILRQINESYRHNYDLLVGSGLYASLIANNQLLQHEEVGERRSASLTRNDYCYKVIRPEKVPFISYPYEWCFSQLKDAALMTLALQKSALEFGMVLKDASAFNIQFFRGKPLLIDTLSFERYEEGAPWVAYRQFCQHFLAPLTLMAYADSRLGQLTQNFIDGIPLDLVANLLPKKTLLDLGVLTHVHMQSKFQRKYAKQGVTPDIAELKLSKDALLGIVDSLESTVKSLRLKDYDSFWRNYYKEHNYSDTAFSAKHGAIEQFLAVMQPKSLVDLGANNGEFSRLASKRGCFTVATDMDGMTVEANYQKAKADNEENLLPLIVDLCAPAPAIGWANRERTSFSERASFDAAMALALIHHLAIGNNVPLNSIADYMSEITDSLIIEFVPKSDSQVLELLQGREDVFPDYNETSFEQAFQRHFPIGQKVTLQDSSRTLYLMRK